MRRIAVAVAMLLVVLPSQALADPFEHLSHRVAQYEDSLEASGQAVPQAEPVPTPMPQSGEDMGFYPDEGVWEEPMGDYYYDDGSFGSCCCVPPGFWGRAEYVAWWVRGANTPPLVTTSLAGTPVGVAGILPNSQILFGDGTINTSGVSGGRFTLGYWADPCQTLGIEDTFFFVGAGNDSYYNSSSGLPILARPFYDTLTGAQDALLLAYPEIVVGSIDITSSRTIASNELNLRRALYVDCCKRVDVLAGYRYVYLGEGLNIRTNTTSIDGTVPVGTNFAIEDSFNTRNQFNGGQLGLNFQLTRGCWTFDVAGKLALGGVSQRVVINGQTVRTIPTETPVTLNGGILALDSNIGTYNRTEFGVLPQIDLNLRYQWSPLWTVSLGYTFMALTNVVRPGDQIDLRLDPAQFPPGVPGTFPTFAFADSDLWLQGLSVGLECNF